MLSLNDGKNAERLALSRALISWRDTGHLRFKPAMDQVRGNQPWNPSEPTTSWAEDFRDLVAEFLGLPMEEWEQVFIFTAIGTALDRFHGVDAFVEFHSRVVTIDVTINPNKVRGSYKANFIVDLGWNLRNHQNPNPTMVATVGEIAQALAA